MRGLPRGLAPVRAATLVAVGTGLILGATYLPEPVSLVRGATSPQASSPQADPVTLTRSVCPGPEAIGVEGLPDSSGQTVSVAAVGAPAAALPAGYVTGGDGSLTFDGLPAGGIWPRVPATLRGQVISVPVSTARSALATGNGVMAPGVAATQWSWTRTGTSRGLVTAACLPASVSSWLVGGGAAPGRLEHLVLANPGPNPVTVDLSILGVSGRIESPDAKALVVAGRSRTVILVDAIAGAERSPVVHVTVRGGKVSATLSDTWLDGVVPRGGDDVVSLVAPGREQVIPGVPVDGRAVLRVGVPGDTEAVVQARVLTAGGPKVLPAGGVTRVAGGSTKDIDLSSLPPGTYAVQVRADVPVVAAVMVDRRRAASEASDLAWPVATAPIRALAGMPLPALAGQGVTQRLDLVATGRAASVLVTTVDSVGQAHAKKVVMSADSVSTAPLTGATSVWVTRLNGIVRAAVLSSVTDAAGMLLSVTPMTDLTLTAAPAQLRQLADQPGTALPGQGGTAGP